MSVPASVSRNCVSAWHGAAGANEEESVYAIMVVYCEITSPCSVWETTTASLLFGLSVNGALLGTRLQGNGVNYDVFIDTGCSKCIVYAPCIPDGGEIMQM